MSSPCNSKHTMAVTFAAYIICIHILLNINNAQIEVINVTSAWSSGVIQCATAGYTECIINCLVDQACGCPSNLYCGATVRCSSGATIPCTINCRGDSSTCFYGEFYAESSSPFIINAAGTQALRGANIYPPNGGDLKIQLIPNPTGSDNYVMKHINVLTSSTNAPSNIHVICDYAGIGGCEQIEIHAEFVTGNVVLECINGGNCWDARLDSPETSNGQTFINCDYGTSTDVSDDICQSFRVEQRNTNTNLRLRCDTTLGSQACNDLLVKCSPGDAIMNALSNGATQWTFSPSANADCIELALPTASPSLEPTMEPTAITPATSGLPSSSPTEITPIPTITPSDIPSVSPSRYSTVSTGYSTTISTNVSLPPASITTESVTASSGNELSTTEPTIHLGGYINAPLAASSPP